jgi:hypothetical protein
LVLRRIWRIRVHVTPVVLASYSNDTCIVGLKVALLFLLWLMGVALRSGPGYLNRIFRLDRWGVCRELRKGQRREVGLIGCHAVKARMRASLIVEAQIAADRSKIAKRLEDGKFRWPSVQDGVMRLNVITSR